MCNSETTTTSCVSGDSSTRQSWKRTPTTYIEQGKETCGGPLLALLGRTVTWNATCAVIILTLPYSRDPKIQHNNISEKLTIKILYLIIWRIFLNPAFNFLNWFSPSHCITIFSEINVVINNFLWKKEHNLTCWKISCWLFNCLVTTE